MAFKGPDTRVVPAFARERDGFEVQRVTNTERRSEDTMASRIAVARLKANARSQRDDRERAAQARLDLSSHSRSSKALSVGKRLSAGPQKHCLRRLHLDATPINLASALQIAAAHAPLEIIHLPSGVTVAEVPAGQHGTGTLPSVWAARVVRP